MFSRSSRGDIVLYLVSIMVLIAAVLIGMLVHDEREELDSLCSRTKAAWFSARTCLEQRNAILGLTVRILMKEEEVDPIMLIDIQTKVRALNYLLKSPLPTRDFVVADRAMETLVSNSLALLTLRGQKTGKFEKLADLLASSQNRLALRKMRYDQNAARLMHEMRTLQGMAVSHLVDVAEPVFWATMRSANA